MNIERCKTRADARGLWERYLIACDSAEMDRAFDLPTFRFPLLTEHVFAVTVGGVEAAVGSYIIDAYGTSAATRAGVFPAYRRMGIWAKMLPVLRDAAFEHHGVDAIRTCVLLSNVEHAARMMKMSRTESWYVFDGMTLHPPALNFITTRKAWFSIYGSCEVRREVERG